MRQISKWLAFITPILGIIVISVLLLTNTVEISVFRPQYRTTYYDVITLITSSDFSQYPYSKIDIGIRICPLICTVIIAIATVLSIFYKNNKCVILSVLMMLIAVIVMFIVRINLQGCNCMIAGDWDNYICVLDQYYWIIGISAIAGSLLLYTHSRYRQENDLGPMV